MAEEKESGGEPVSACVKGGSGKFQTLREQTALSNVSFLMSSIRGYCQMQKYCPTFLI